MLILDFSSGDALRIFCKEKPEFNLDIAVFKEQSNLDSSKIALVSDVLKADPVETEKLA